MILRNILWINAVALAAALVGCNTKDPDANDFGNKAYIAATVKTAETKVTQKSTDIVKTIEVALAKPAPQQVSFVLTADESLVELYNQAYYDDAVMLPADYFEIADPNAVIPQGAVRSNGVDVNFHSLSTLDVSQDYVLPVTISQATGVGVLASARTMYYLFSEGALINVAANIEKNYLTPSWATSMTSVPEVTFEALVRASAFDRPGSEQSIATIMGVEDRFLVRTGDSNYPGQLQVVIAKFKYPGRSAAKVLPLGKWVHVAVTYSSTAKKVKIYVNGALQSEETADHGAVNLASAFYVGRSYSLERYWMGDISEVRVWNVIRTEEEIAANRYEIASPTTATGLVAYWKFDEATGKVINDRTGHNNTLTANATLKWVDVAIPEPQK